MSELAKRLNSLVDSRASELGVNRQSVIQEIAEETEFSQIDVVSILSGEVDFLADEEQRYWAFSVFGQDAAGELAGLYELERPRLPQIREVIPRATYERLQAIKEELSQALAD